MGPEGALGVATVSFPNTHSTTATTRCSIGRACRAQPYEALHRRLLELSPAELRQRQQDADSAFLHQGVTFTVYGDDQGTERIFPYDLLPRIITAREWETIERGLIQRLTALNLFLKDIYQDGRILKEGIVPRAARLQRAALPPRDDRHPAAARHLRVGGRHRISCGCRTASSPCSKTTCACRAACRTC